MMPQDSTGQPINEGDKVRFRGQIYTINNFGPCAAPYNVRDIYFVEDQHTIEIANEISVDKI